MTWLITKSDFFTLLLGLVIGAAAPRSGARVDQNPWSRGDTIGILRKQIRDKSEYRFHDRF
jgi:hypothetical protein